MSKFRKLVKRILLATLGAVVLLTFTLYFVLQYRIKLVLKEVVAMETNGAYTLDFSDHSFSLFKANIKLKNARFDCVKPIAGETSYNVKIPNFYIAIDSWKSLLWDKKLIVDSLYAESPEINVMEANRMFTGNKVSVQLNDAYQALKEVTSRLEIQILAVKNATLGLYPSDSVKPFMITQLDLGVHNFALRSKESRHFLLTDDIDISIKNQDWVLAAGDSLSFSKLHFSAKNQRFTIDSCSLTTTNIEKGRVINVKADRFFVNSSNLTAAYLQNKLIIDTLTCINPVVQFERETERKKDSTRITGTVGKVFSGLSFKYISIVDGQLLLSQKKDGSWVSYASKKSNIRLYDLDVITGRPSSISLRDLKFDLDTVRFYTPDSLYVLRVNSFSIQNSDLVCSNASFLPVGSAGNMKLFLPQITLRNISLPDLWQKKLKADEAQIERPEIYITAGGGTKKILPVKAKNRNNPYGVLKDFSSVVDVNRMSINEGKLEVLPAAASGTTVRVNGINAFIELNKLFQSGSVIDIKKTFSRASFKTFQLQSPKMNLALEDIVIHSAAKGDHIGKATIQLANGIDLRARGVLWNQLDWGALYKQEKLDIDQLSFSEVDLRYNPVSAKKNAGKTWLLPFNINQFKVTRLNAQLKLFDSTRFNTGGNNIEVTGLVNNGEGIQWKDINAVLQNASYVKEGVSVAAEDIVLDKQGGSSLKNTTVSFANGNLFLPEIKLSTTITNTNLSNLHLEYLTLNDPQVMILNGKGKGNEKGLDLPFNLTADKLKVNNAKLDYRFADSSRLNCTATMAFNSFRLSTGEGEILKYRSGDVALENAEWENDKITATLASATLKLPATSLQKNQDNIFFESGVLLKWMNAGMQFKDSSKYQLKVSGVNGEMSNPRILVRTGEKWSWADIAQKVKLSDGRLYFSDKKNTVTASRIIADAGKGQIELDSVSMIPRLSKDRFFEFTQWQKDYREIFCGKLTINNVDVPKFINNGAVEIKTVTLQNAMLTTSRDKNMPFEHGIEKPMPTKLIANIKRPVYIHSVLIKDASIITNEIAVATQREGSIPFMSVNGEIRNINSRPKAGDSLYVSASAKLLDYHIRSFRYQESYSDSLSGFHLSARLSPMDLTAFSKISNPLAALDVKSGKADTLYTRMAGNKYGSFGEIKFYYQKLKLRFLNPMDTTKKNFGLSFKNFVANEFVLKTNNKKQVQVFYVRDTERFIFNYWFRSIFSGVIASVGIRTDKNYVKQHNKLQEIYLLPAKE